MSLPMPAHPRSRGENDGRLVGVRRDAGSSPLTRGQLLGIAWSVFQVRLIPAHAGKTRPYLACCAGGAAHPRSRGENESNETMALPLSGSSPLTRGKLRTRGPTHRRRRLIPAHAGKTCSRRRTGRRQRAHPRSRGENRSRRVSTVAGCGSSPLTRGKRPVLPRWQPLTRLIPAHAGKT